MLAAMTPRRTPGHVALRKGRCSLPGQPYLVKFTTRRRLPHFVDAAVAVRACRAVEDPRLWQHSRLLAWVLMPDHWHGLLVPSGADTLSSLVGRLKTNTARQAGFTDPALRSVWARGFHDHALRREEALIDVARYIIRNPVAAGLVKRVGDYPYWNAAWL
jgi:REP element-mobilizing transposase RayT